MIPPERLWILTNDDLREEHHARSFRTCPAIRCWPSPMQRNTAPAIGLAAHILRSLDPEAVMGVFPSDHVIGKPAPYRKALKAAFRAPRRGT